MSMQDRWGEIDQSESQGDTESSLTWIWIFLALLVLLAVFGGGFMFLRARQAEQMALMERDRAMQAEMQLRLVQQAQQQALKLKSDLENDVKLLEIERSKTEVFADHPEAIETGNKLMKQMTQPGDGGSIDAFVGQEAVFFGMTDHNGNNNDLRLRNDIRLSVQIIASSESGATVASPTAFVLGKIKSIDRDRKVIAIEVEPENWRPGKPN